MYLSFRLEIIGFEAAGSSNFFTCLRLFQTMIGGRASLRGTGRSPFYRGGQSGRGRGRGWGRGRGVRYSKRGSSSQRDGGGNDDIEEIGIPTDSSISVAVEGCCHGELDTIYERLQQHEAKSGRKVDLLISCGDFQSLRNLADFHSLAVPPKYRALGSFYKYYSGEKTAPILTIFVGGNHEASQALQELPYGGWVAPNIYYLATSIVRYQGIRIGGISGIHKAHDFTVGRFERPPYDRSSLRSVYHVRNVDIYRMKCISDLDPIDIIVSHDWPQGIEQYGDTNSLLRRKPFFREEIAQNCLGSPGNIEILRALKPKWWFAAHLHVKFHATVKHGAIKAGNASKDTVTSLIPSQTVGLTTQEPVEAENEEESKTRFLGSESVDRCNTNDLTDQMTRFLSLDKCLPRRHYMSILHLPVKECKDNAKLEYDLEWLAVVRKTHSLTMATSERIQVPPKPSYCQPLDLQWIEERLGKEIPLNFHRNVPSYVGPSHPLPHPLPPPYSIMGNRQTDELLNVLGLVHITTVPFLESSERIKSSISNETDIREVGKGSDSGIFFSASDQSDENAIDLDDECGEDLEAEPMKRPRTGS